MGILQLPVICDFPHAVCMHIDFYCGIFILGTMLQITLSHITADHIGFKVISFPIPSPCVIISPFESRGNKVYHVFEMRYACILGAGSEDGRGRPDDPSSLYELRRGKQRAEIKVKKLRRWEGRQRIGKAGVGSRKAEGGKKVKVFGYWLLVIGLWGLKINEG